MVVENSIGSKVLLRLVISVLTIISLESRVASVRLKDEFCKPAECSDDMIGHPHSNATAPSTSRSCQNDCPDDEPILILRPFGEHLVDYDNQSHMLRSDFDRWGYACFAPTKQFREEPRGSDTDGARFDPPSFLKSNQTPSYLVLLHNCGSFPNVDHPNPYLTCRSFVADCYCVALVSQPNDTHLILSACASHVFVPVELAEGDTHEEKWTHGFKLAWHLDSWERCVKCKKGGGKCREERDGSFLCEGGNTYRLIPCSSNNLNSAMCFSANLHAMLSNLDKEDFKGRGRTFGLPLVIHSQFLFPSFGFIHQGPLLLFIFLLDNTLQF